MMLFEFTCPLDSTNHLEQARTRNRVSPDRLLSELDRLDIPNYYETLEISLLGH